MELSAIVIRVNDKVKDFGDLLAIARAEAQKRHGVKRGSIEVKEIVFVPSLGVYVALYKAPDARGERSKAEH